MALDSTRYDAVLTQGSEEIGLIYWESGDAQASSRLVPTQPQRIDTGSEFETRTEAGNFFSQGEFLGGAGQLKFHSPATAERPGSDQTKFFYAEGFDINNLRGPRFSDVTLQHLRLPTAHPSNVNVPVDAPFTIANSVLITGSGTGAVTMTSPTGATTLEAIGSAALDFTSDGSQAYAATALGVYRRITAGTWARWQPDAATNLDVVNATKILWHRGRMFVATATKFYEVVNVSAMAATPLDSWPTGWVTQDIFTNGKHVYVAIVSTVSAECEIRHYTYDDTTAAFVPQGLTTFPKSELIYCGVATVGLILLGGAKQLDGTNQTPTFWRAFPDDTGALTYEKIAQGPPGGAANNRVKVIETYGNLAVFNWKLPSGPNGARAGLAAYNLAHNSFSHFLKVPSASTNEVSGVAFFQGVWMFHNAAVIYYEDTAAFTATTTFISSGASWNNSSVKSWSSFEIELATFMDETAEVSIYYSTSRPEDNSWTLVGTYGDPGLGTRFDLTTPISARSLWIKIVSTAAPSGFSAPEIKSFTVRSDDQPSTTEWRESRYVILADGIRKDPNAEPVAMDPRSVRNSIKNMANEWLTLTEPDGTYACRLVDFFDYEPGQPILDETSGTEPEETYILGLVLQGRKTA